MFFSQKYKNKKKTNSLRARFARNFIQLFLAAFCGFFIAVFLFHFALECLLAVNFVAGLEYIFFFFWVRISLDIETFERVLCNYSISWRCKQPNSSAYLALIADLQLILPISIYRLYGHIELQPRSQRMHFQSQVKDATAQRERDRGGNEFAAQMIIIMKLP